MPQVFRTFVAVELSTAVVAKAQALIGRLRQCEAQVRWNEPRQMHITLNFLGDVVVNGISDVCQLVAEAAAEHPAFDLSLTGAGAFPTSERPRIVWLGVTQGAQQLVALQNSLADALEVLGFQRESRPFTPHLTIGRVKSASRGDRTLPDLLRREAGCQCGRMRVGEVVVFSSTLSPKGPTYEPLARAPLAAG